MKVLVNGPEPDEANIIVILLHGRGADGDDIMGLSAEFEDEDICWMAPTSMNNSWYPDSFLERRARNEPYLTLSVEQIKGLLDQFPAEKLVLGGFSQGACLTADILARHTRELAGAWMFSGGIIGHEEEMPKVEGSLKGLPVCLSGSLRDPHIPAERMKQTALHLEKMGADVKTLHYDLNTHQIAAEELELAKEVLLKVRSRMKS
jgi:phospholipase/carboxylesterase